MLRSKINGTLQYLIFVKTKKKKILGVLSNRSQKIQFLTDQNICLTIQLYFQYIESNLTPFLFIHVFFSQHETYFLPIMYLRFLSINIDVYIFQAKIQMVDCGSLYFKINPGSQTLTKFRSGLGLYHTRPYQPPTVVSKVRLGLVVVKQGNRGSQSQTRLNCLVNQPRAV